MARTQLDTQDPGIDGLAVAFTAASADGHMIDGGGDVTLLVRNDDTNPVTMTVQTPGNVDGLAVDEHEVNINSDGDLMAVGPFRPSTFDRPSGATNPGKVYIDFSAVTDLYVAAISHALTPAAAGEVPM